MSIVIFTIALFILIWTVVKVHNALNELNIKAVKLEQNLHTTRKKLYKVSSALDNNSSGYFQKNLGRT